MRIEGTNGKDINEITLKHSGKQLNFQCFIKPFPYAPRADLVKIENTTIIFDDIREIESMIEMLTRMRGLCSDYIGVWKAGADNE